MPQSCAKIFPTLAHLLGEHQVCSNTISHALQVLCDEFSFEYGLMYELESPLQFRMTECSTDCNASIPDPFSISDLTGAERTNLAQRTLHLFQNDKQSQPLESRFLHQFQAESAVIFPIADENAYIYGFMTLLHSSEKLSLTQEQQETLSAAAFMLVHYVRGRLYQKRIAQSRATLEKILDNTGIDIYVNDFYTHEILYVNQSMAAPYGGSSLFMGKTCWNVLFPGQNAPCEFCPKEHLVDEEGHPLDVYSWDYQRPFDGSWFRVFSAAFYWDDGRLAHIVSSADITENKKNEALIENLANYDQLTKLPNRRMLVQECERRIHNATATEQEYLLFFDIDGFKAINDQYGHDAGDDFLIQLGAFFSSIPLLANATYRNGGDEFVAIIGGESVTKNNIRSLAHFIHARFKKVWHLKSGDVYCSTSIGVACYPEDGVTVEALLQKADMAMYQVKKQGGNNLCFGYQLDVGQKK